MSILLSPETTAYWYFRLNGFMTMENFILHPDSGNNSQRTDADIYGVRFPFRKELKMQDDVLFDSQPPKPFFIIAEITRGECKLNGPWTESEKENVQYVLRAIGALEPKLIQAVAEKLYTRCWYEDELRKIQLLAVGSRASQDFSVRYPDLPQILFKTMLEFIYARFSDFRMQKSNHQQWDNIGKLLYEAASKSQTKDEFVAKMLKEAGLEAAQ